MVAMLFFPLLHTMMIWIKSFLELGWIYYPYQFPGLWFLQHKFNGWGICFIKYFNLFCACGKSSKYTLTVKKVHQTSRNMMYMVYHLLKAIALLHSTWHWNLMLKVL